MTGLGYLKYIRCLTYSMALSILLFVVGCRDSEQGGVANRPVNDVSGAAKYSVIPKPDRLVSCRGQFVFSDDTRVYAGESDALGFAAEYLIKRIRQLLGMRLAMATKPQDASIHLKFDDALKRFGDEAYSLHVSPSEITISAATAEGVFYGVQSLCQLLPLGDNRGGAVACVEITDMPEFKWRGVMLDVSRHFFSVAFLKRYIDLLAIYKINVLHLHLTDDQGWRLEIKKYPKLTEIGAWRTEDGRRYGGFYTQEEMRDLVAYAARRFITIVPEIDIPGHSQAALAAYPEYGCGSGKLDVRLDLSETGDGVFCVGNEKTFSFLEDVLDEVMDIFPSEYIHIGVDEVETKHWEKCGKCRALMKREHMRSPSQVQGYFAKKISAYIESRGRKVICWDDLLEDQVPDGATIMFWRTWMGTDLIRQAARDGHSLILSPISHFYLSGEPPLEYIYSYSPDKSGLVGDLAKRVLGGTACLWTEHISSPADVERFSFPQLCAFSEAVWSPLDKRDWNDFKERLWHHYSLLEADKVNVDIPAPGGFADRTLFYEPLLQKIRYPEIAKAYYTTRKSGDILSIGQYDKPLQIDSDTVLQVQISYPDGRQGPIRKGVFRKISPLKPLKPGLLLPGLIYRYYEGKFKDTLAVRDLEFVRRGTVDRFRIPAAVRNDFFALEFEGMLRIETGGEYTFSTRSDDGSRLWIGEQLVVDNWGLRPLQTRSGRVMLRPGFYPIRLEFVEGTEDEILDVFYTAPGGWRREIPSSLLYTPIPAGTSVFTTLEPYAGHNPRLAVDGDDTTFFWSNRRIYQGDRFTFIPPARKPVKTIRVVTGKPDGVTDILRHGVLEISENGRDYRTVAEFKNGKAEAEIDAGKIKVISIRATEGQDDWLIIREIVVK